jgi:electron-transferring-flavoprotein dehydrogenase
MGYPLRTEEFGGAFIYGMPDGLVSVGFVSGLDYRDPMFDPHLTFQRFKQHPFVSGILAGGKMVRYGAKALPEGGWHTVPRVYMDGGLIAGDAGGFMNSMRLKGIHLAMRTGMLAAETAFEAVRAGDVSASKLSAYKTRIDASPVRRELYPVRNVHQAFGHGLFAGLIYSGHVAGDGRDGGSGIRCRHTPATSASRRWRTTTTAHRRPPDQPVDPGQESIAS